MYLVVALLSAAVWDTARLTNWFGTAKTKDIMATNQILNSICVVYYLLLACIIFLSWKNNETVLKYLGFMRGNISKTVFLLFCGTMVFPCNKEATCVDSAGCPTNTDDWVNWFGGAFLSAAAIV